MHNGEKTAGLTVVRLRYFQAAGQFATEQLFYRKEWECYWPQGDGVCWVASSPGGLAMKESTLYLITQENCANCPAAEAVVEEAIDGSPIPMKIIDLKKMDPDLEFRLLENQVFIASTPSIILENHGMLKLLYSGTVPSVEDMRKQLGMN